ncbi:hypothetical protein N5J70_21275 [Pseudomonas sp. GD03909]|nr:hypothetical protein [Pseudomonas sp. GD03909]
MTADDRGNSFLRDLRAQLGRDPETGLTADESTRERVNQILANLADNEDARVNFRINSAVKEEFERLCQQRSSTFSRELRRFMIQAISRQRFWQQ